jgi:hypothetical protein
MKRLSFTLFSTLVFVLAFGMPGYANINQSHITHWIDGQWMNATADQSGVIQSSQPSHLGLVATADKGDGDNYEADDDQQDNNAPDSMQQPGHEHDARCTPKPEHTHRAGQQHEFRGRIESMNGNVWMVGGQTVGAMVGVEAECCPDGVLVATKIKGQRWHNDGGRSYDVSVTNSPSSAGQSQVRRQCQMQTNAQLNLDQGQAIQSISEFIHWLMKALNFDLSQIWALVSVQGK